MKANEKWICFMEWEHTEVMMEYIQDNESITKRKDKEKYNIIMVIHTKVNLRQIKSGDKELTSLKAQKMIIAMKNIQDNSKKIKNMVKESIFDQREIDMMGNEKMTKEVETEFIIIKIRKISMMENGKKTVDREKEKKLIQTMNDMKDNGIKIKKKEKELTYLKIKINMKVIFTKINGKDKEKQPLKTMKYTKEIGTRTSQKEKEYILLKITESEKDNG